MYETKIKKKRNMRCCEITCYGNKMHRKYNKMHAGGVQTVSLGVYREATKKGSWALLDF